VSVWSFISYVLLPLGVVVCACILSGVKFLERIGTGFCKFELRAGELRIRLPLFVLLVSVVCFAGEFFELKRLETHRFKHVDTAELWRSQLWRHQRNWWLSGFCTILWAIVWRFSGLVGRFRAQIESIRKVD